MKCYEEPSEPVSPCGEGGVVKCGGEIEEPVVHFKVHIWRENILAVGGLICHFVSKAKSYPSVDC